MTSGPDRWQHWLAQTGAAALVALALAPAAWAVPRDTLKMPDTQFVPTDFAEIEGWDEDDHDAAFATFLKSCRAILRSSADMREARPLLSGLYDACRKAVSAKRHQVGEARAFFEQNFRPVRISPLGETDGFLTGYYEPIVEGARTQTGEFKYPLYRKPPNLLPGGRMLASHVANRRGKGKRAKRRLVSFHDRAAIDDGVLAGRDLEICWLRDPIDAFFIHIQGSVRVRLDEGKTLRLNYLAQNGHPYYAVGRSLIERKIVPKEEMSMDRIRQWMEANPAEGRELRRKNKSYIFFRETNLADNEEPVGAQGVSLTPGRSIAVDRNLHVYGTPFFISTELPIDSDQPTAKFRHLMVAQDTGGAIIGPARADIYFGAGDEVGSISGRVRHPGRFVMLMPKVLVPAAEDVPMPRPKPPIVEVAATDQAAKASTARQRNAKTAERQDKSKVRSKRKR
jgi:membrane-bound lytic murein transglycosylase A